MTATGLACAACGIELPPNSKFCNKCGAAVATATTQAEYKQVTVLFAHVVHSMDIAAAVGAERLREIMADLADRGRMVARCAEGWSPESDGASVADRSWFPGFHPQDVAALGGVVGHEMRSLGT